MKLSSYFGPLALGAAMVASLAFAQSQPIPGAKTASGQPAPVTGAAIVMAPAGGGAGLGTVVAVDNPLVVNCVSGCSGGGGGGGATAAANGTVVVTAGTGKPQAIDLFSSTSVLVKDTTGAAVDWSAPVPVTQSGAWSLSANQSANLSQVAGVTTATGNGVATTGTQRVTIASDNTAFPVTAANATASNLNAQVVGALASNTTNTSNPVSIGATYTATPPTFTTGAVGNLQMSANGSLRVWAGVNSAAGADSVANNIGFFGRNDTSANTGPVSMASALFNGSTWDRQRTIGDAATSISGLGVAAVAVAPTSAAGQAIVPSASTVVEGNRVLKASAGNLYRLIVNTGATAGWVGVSNTTTNPADGAVTPLICRQVAANSTLTVDYAQLPARFSTGISAWFSTTGCFTKTQSATATFEGFVQ